MSWQGNFVYDTAGRWKAPTGLASSLLSPVRRDPTTVDLVCFSHLRWDFVLQRPQHLLRRCMRDRRVFFVEEPVFVDDANVGYDASPRADGVIVVVPRLPHRLAAEEVDRARRVLVDEMFADYGISEFVSWYYTPMALPFSRHLHPRAVVYDCMDELSGFAGAPAALRETEAQLFRHADVVFTGGQSLFEVKRKHHANTHVFPSSIDAAHFGQGRNKLDEPGDQVALPHPRLGYVGVIDERMDLDLVAAVADLRPDWQLVMVGPVVKIDPATLPQRPNIHYLGSKSYDDLPTYLAGWDVAMMPFALNESTRFISPTKTPEYLAAGRPVISTPIHDVVRPYGEEGLVEIAATPAEFVEASERVMSRTAGDYAAWLERVDERLARTSWDSTWARMWEHVERAAAVRASPARATIGVGQFASA